MKTTVTETNFRDAFMNIRPDNFSYEGLGALFEYLEHLEEDIDQEIELDVIAICCEFSEYETLGEAVNYYGLEILDDEQTLDYLQQRTTVIELDNNGIILQDY